MNWTFASPWGVRVVAAAAVVLLLLVVARWWRERRGGWATALRCAVLAGLVWVWLNPQALVPREQTGKARLAVLVDVSESMGTADVEGGTRLAAALRVLRDPATQARWSRDFDVEFREFDRGVRAVDLTARAGQPPTGDATDLREALLRVVGELGEQPSQAGVLVVSDGRSTAPAALEAAELALARTVPLWTWCLGGAVPRHDLELETAASEVLAFNGAEVELGATLRAAGYPQRSFRVTLWREAETVATTEVLPDANGVGRVSFRVTAPASGEQRYLLRVPAEPEEADTANNERALFVRAVGEKVRVLVAEGQPHWDTKFLVQSLKRDPRVDLTAVYRISATRHLAVRSATGTETRVDQDLFPRTAEAMNAFDVIVLGRGAEAFFDSGTERLLTEFVAQRGGSLLFARGKAYGGRFPALAKLEPVAWGTGVQPGIRLRPTEAGRGHPVFDLGAAGTLEELLDRMPALDQASLTLGEKPLAVVLAESAQADGPALLAYQRYGEGKTLSLNATGLWRWAFRETGQEASEIAYRRFWVSLLQWLLGGSQFLPGADVALSSPRRYYHSEEPMRFLVTTRQLDRDVYRPALLVVGGGRTNRVEPRLRGDAWVAEAGPFPPGTYQVTLTNNIGRPSTLTQTIEVVSASLERREFSADSELMRQLAAKSGGRVVGADDVRRMDDVVRRWEAERQLAQRQRPIWDRGWLLALLVVWLGGEWWLRRREGLL